MKNITKKGNKSKRNAFLFDDFSSYFHYADDKGVIRCVNCHRMMSNPYACLQCSSGRDYGDIHEPDENPYDEISESNALSAIGRW